MGEFSPIIVRLEIPPKKYHQLTGTGGKGLGGSSMINGFYYGRGTSTVYDLWESRGNPGWSWDDVYPLFIKVSVRNVTRRLVAHPLGHPFQSSKRIQRLRQYVQDI